MNGIDNIINRIAEDAEKTSCDIIAAAEADARAVREEYAAKAENMRDAILSRGKAAAEEKRERLESAASLEARKELLAKKQELISRAFDEAVKSLESLSDEERADVLARLALIAAAGGKGEIILSAKEKEKLGKKVLEKCTENKGIALSEETREIGGGLIFRDEKSEINCTFKTLAAELRDSMSREIADILFG